MGLEVFDQAVELLHNAKEEFKPVKTYVMFSGGNDSTVLLDAMWKTGMVDAAAHINTGIGIEQTREFVRSFCKDRGIPLIEKHPPQKTYEELVVELGFPGPPMHNVMYRMLKERAVRVLVKEAKTKRTDRVMLVTGIRQSESSRRMQTSRVPVERLGAQVWVNPLFYAHKRDLVEYRRTHGVPENEVSAILHMSGECLCGAYAKPGEFEELEMWYPAAAAQIRELEAKVEAAGRKHCRWGKRRFDATEPVEAAGPLCTACDAAFDQQQAA